MSSPLDTVPRSVYARVLLVEVPEASATVWRDELEREDIVVFSSARVIEGAAKISPELVHVVVTLDSMTSQARAVLEEAAAEVGAEVIALGADRTGKEALDATVAAIKRVKARRKSM